jgi:putative Holliday junction resolvase
LSRVVGIDYGLKRCGIAATDSLRIAVHGLTTVPKTELLDFLKDYCDKEDVETIVVGHPELITKRQTPMTQSLEDFVSKLKLQNPDVEVIYHDESYSSQSASQVILASGARKKKRREKGLLDKISAILILQDYLGHL